MRYLIIVIVYFLSIYFFSIFNYIGEGWQFISPFLVSLLLVYFNTDNHWIYYSFAGMAGLYVDSITAAFGLNTFIFITIVFGMKTLQLTWLTEKNISAVIILTIFGFIMYWLLFWAVIGITSWDLYMFSEQPFVTILKYTGYNVLATLVIHLLYFNLWTRRHEKKQSF